MKKLFAVCCITLLILSLLPTKESSANTNFTDVGTTHRAQEEIYYLVQGKITSGITTSQFAPDRLVTRAEAAIFLGRALGLNGEKKATQFPDVSINHGASGYIQAMVDQNIIKGFPNGKFYPDVTLTRGQMAILISRSFNYGADSASTASTALVNRGISDGISDGSFGEQLTMKRSDFAVFLTRGINSKYRSIQNVSFNQKFFVNTNSLNFRVGPNTYFNSIGKLNTGQEVEYAYSIGDWSYVRANGQVGFLHSNYLQLSKPNSTTPISNPVVEPIGGKLSDLVVIIDPGHGGSDPGGLGYGYQEKNVVLNIGKHMDDYFSKIPIQAKMTRTGDTYPSLADRVLFAKENNGDVFVSLHTNALNGTANGTESFYYANTAATNPYVNESRALAIYLQNRMVEVWNLRNRGVNPFGYGNFYVLRENTMPATLVEMGFLDNSFDIKYLSQEVERKKMGRALFLGVLDYYHHYEGRSDIKALYSTVNGVPSSKLH